MDKKTILVVDDDPDARDCVNEILTTRGYTSIPCADTPSAQALLASGASLDLAIIDISMQEMSGVELHGWIKQLWPGLPCIVISGYSPVEHDLSAIDNGGIEYLRKPYRIRELQSVVAAALRKTAMMSKGASVQVLDQCGDRKCA